MRAVSLQNTNLSFSLYVSIELQLLLSVITCGSGSLTMTSILLSTKIDGHSIIFNAILVIYLFFCADCGFLNSILSIPLFAFVSFIWWTKTKEPSVISAKMNIFHSIHTITTENENEDRMKIKMKSAHEIMKLINTFIAICDNYIKRNIFSANYFRIFRFTFFLSCRKIQWNKLVELTKKTRQMIKN